MYEQQISKGIEWLDQHEPGWADKVDLEKLDMTTCTRCVLGFVYGDYDRLDDPSAPPSDDRAKLGFTLRESYFSYDWVRLTEEWRDAISKLRNHWWAVPESGWSLDNG